MPRTSNNLHCVYSEKWNPDTGYMDCINSWGSNDPTPKVHKGDITDVYSVDIVLQRSQGGELLAMTAMPNIPRPLGVLKKEELPKVAKQLIRELNLNMPGAGEESEESDVSDCEDEPSIKTNTDDLDTEDPLAKAMSEQLAKAVISKGKLERAQSILYNITTDHWNESMRFDVTKKVKNTYLNEFIGSLMKTLKLPKKEEEHVKEKLKQLKLIKKEGEVQVKMIEISYKEEAWNSVYGVLMAMKNTDKSYTIGYAMHMLNFKISKSTGVTPEDIQNIKTVYCRFKALDTLLEEGVIPEIKYSP